MKLPEEYLIRMQQMLKDDYPAYLDSFQHNRYYGLKVNTAKISVEDFLKICPFHLEHVPWCPEGFYYDGENDKPAKHPYYYAGLYYLQEPSAMLPASILPIEEGDIVLDGCAAPGGKSVQLASKLHNSGLLVANDISASRCQGLLKNLQLQGSTNAVVSCCDISQFNIRFDRILIDAPCSGEGMFRKEPALISSWQKKNGEYYSPIQKELLDKAVNLLKPGGELVYSTCTFDPQEDEEVVQSVLNNYPDLHLQTIEKNAAFSEGLKGLSECVRLYPHKIQGEGHFVALLKKEGTREHQSSELPIVEVEEEVLRQIDPSFFKGYLKRIDDRLLLEKSSMAFQSIRMISSGLLLGRYKGNSFEPSQALALALQKEQFDQVIDLDDHDERVIRYLRGETINCSEYSYKGWVLVCCDGYPLGFGKIDNQLFKNKYDRNWRYV